MTEDPIKDDIKSIDVSEKSLRAKKISGLISVVSFILGLPLLASAIWLFYMRSYTCEHVLNLPRFQIGIAVALIFMFLLNNASLFLRSRYPMQVLMAVAGPLIVMFVVGLSFTGAYPMDSGTITASPSWFRSKVGDDSNWNNIKSCLFDNDACHHLIGRAVPLKGYEYNMQKMTAMESGCCKPPNICEMVYVNATYWRKDTAMTRFDLYDKDCDVWRNSRKNLCYNCQACKIGFAETLQSKWWKLGVFFVVFGLLLMVSHLLLLCSTMWELYG